MTTTETLEQKAEPAEADKTADSHNYESLDLHYRAQLNKKQRFSRPY